MNSESDVIGLGEAARRFLKNLPAGEGETSQQEVNMFVRWFGGERAFTELRAPEIASYAERLSLSDIEYARKLELVRAFLVYAKKESWIKINLAAHLKARKGKSRAPSSTGRTLPDTIPITRQGYDELEAELTTLKGKRSEAIDEIRRAAADKDFRENAPLEAAREQRGQLEGRIIELEETLKSAVIIDEKKKATPKVGIGDSIILCDLDSGEELHYTLVSPREVDPTKGKISSASPIGKAIIGKGQGEMVEVVAPAGRLCYQIKQVES